MAKEEAGGVTDKHLLEHLAGLPSSGAVADAVNFRARLMELTQASYEAALMPKTSGGLSYSLRAALACRIARLCGEEALAAHYAARAEGEENARFCSVAEEGETALERAILAYVNVVTRTPAKATGAEIESLQAAGMDEADIVRLAGLVAFVNYQLRVALVLRQLGASS